MCSWDRSEAGAAPITGVEPFVVGAQDSNLRPPACEAGEVP